MVVEMRHYQGSDLFFHVGQLMIASAVGMCAIISAVLGDGAAIPGAIAGALIGLILALRGNGQAKAHAGSSPGLRV